MYKFPVLLISTTIFFSLSVIWLHMKPHVPTQKLMVVCTTTFLADAVRHIAGDVVIIKCLMRPGIDPHVYKATEQDAVNLSTADLIIYHGLHLEGKMAELFHAFEAQKPTIAACNGLAEQELIHADETVYDPHIWFDVMLWINVVKHLAMRLGNFDVEHRTEYEHNAKKYCEHLETLHQELKKQLAHIPHARRVLITAHDAFSYFGKAYNFKVIGLQGVSTDSDISAAHVDSLATHITQHNIPVIFAEMSIPNKGVTAVQEAVARLGKKIDIGPELYTDSLGEQISPASTYEDFMRYTAHALHESLI